LRAGSAGELGRQHGMEQLGFWKKLIEHPSYDSWWQQQAMDKILAAQPLKVPTMLVDSLWDQEDIYGAPALYKALKPKDTGNDKVFLVLGPWHHGQEIEDASTLGALRFNSDLGKHGDTGTSEVEVVRAVLDGRADAGAIGNRFWNTVQSERLVPEGSLREIWSSPSYSHCMFAARPDLDPERERRFADALLAMSYDNPVHRPILDDEGLKRWLPPHVDGYAALRQAAAQQGFFERQLAQSA